jgi:hypothetical protein
VSASALRFRSECPVCAPFSLSFMFVRAILVGNIARRFPDMMGWIYIVLGER